MIAKKYYTKDEEKKILTALVTGDSYFGQIFDADDLAIMCHNIDMDFSLMMNSKFDKAVRTEQEKNDKLYERIMATDRVLMERDSVLAETRLKLAESETELKKVRDAKYSMLTTLLELIGTGDLDSGAQCSLESEIYRSYTGFEIIRAKMACRMPMSQRDFNFVQQFEKAA